ncbi:MAG: DinB family protein [Candidatus Hodarchaeota archaeon]
MKKHRKIISILEQELNNGFQVLVQSLEEISKEEAQWMPSSKSMTLNTIKQWNEKGNEWIKSQTLDPLSTIEFKVIHLAQCKLMYDEYAFRDGNLKWSDIESPEWPYCIEYLKQTQTRLIESIQVLIDNKLEELVHTNWGELWSVKKIIFTMIQHDYYHLGQIYTVKHLYGTMNREINDECQR